MMDLLPYEGELVEEPDEVLPPPEPRCRIPLTQGKFAIVDCEDFEWLNSMKWFASLKRNRWYATRFVDRRPVYMARLIMNPEPRQQVDHINGDSLDNRRSNLRLCVHAQNQQNVRTRNGVFGFRGVRFVNRTTPLAKPWVAEIRAFGVRRHLGYFATAEESARAYDRAAIKLHGDFASLNFPREAARKE